MDERMNRGSRLVALGEAAALPILTVGLFVLFSLMPASSDTFPTAANIQTTLADQAVLILVALAVLLPVVTGVWDFTPGATMGIASVFAASVFAGSGSVLLATLTAGAVGLGVGLVNGLLVTRAKINSVIATFGMTIIIAGLVQLKTRGTSIVQGIPESLTEFGNAPFLGSMVPTIIVVALAVALGVNYGLEHTPVGRYLFAIGSNRVAARLVGVRVTALTSLAFALGGTLAGLAGVLQVARTGAGNPTIGPAFTLPAYAAVFLGAVAIRPGQWNVWGVVIAILFLGTLNSGLVLAGAEPYVNALANGSALLVGVGVANAIAKKRGRELHAT
jgi:ribose transport system permease protein